MNHNKDCNWEKTTSRACEYRDTHHYCPHSDHACNCKELHQKLSGVNPTNKKLKAEIRSLHRKLKEAHRGNERLAYEAKIANGQERVRYDRQWEDHGKLKKDIEALTVWKEDMLKLLDDIDLQEIGGELSVQLGDSIENQVLPGIRNLKKALAAIRSHNKLNGD